MDHANVDFNDYSENTEPVQQVEQTEEVFAKPPDVQMVNLEEVSTDDLLKEAEANFEQMNYDKCNILYEAALSRDIDNEKVLTSYGFFLSNIKEVEKAKEALTKAIVINPNSNPKKYLYMAQLYSGTDAVTFYTKAIEMLTAQLEDPNFVQLHLEHFGEEPDLQDIKKDLSQAYTAMGELYMTDLNTADNAINLCRESLHRAVEINQTNIDGYYQLMNYYLELDDNDKATQSANKFMEVYKAAHDENEDDFFDEYPDETYLGAARVFLEMQRFDDALFILEDMHEDDDTNMEVLYLMIFCNFNLKNYITCKQLLEEFNNKLEHYNDEEIISAKEEIEAELTKVNAEEGNDWEDVDESEEHMSNGSMMEEA